MLAQGQVGAPAASSAPGAFPNARQGNLNELVVSEGRGRFAEAAYRNQIFGAGFGLAAINNATFTVATTGVTATPIVGVFNQIGSTVNLEILQATLAITTTALTATGGGPFVWMMAPTTAALTAAALVNPWNMKTLAQAGSQAKAIGQASATPLTAMTGTLATFRASALGGGSIYNISEVATAAGFHTQLMAFTENFDGSLFVPPGYILALMATTTPVAQSAVAGLIWQEIPL